MPNISKVIVIKNNIPAFRKAISGDGLMKAVKAGGHVIEGAAKINASRGRPGLSIDEGSLTNSITVEEDKKTSTSASVNIGPKVIYAAIHEFGGWIKAKSAKALHFVIDGQHFTKKAVFIPARPYLRPAVDENIPKIQEAIEYQLKSDLGRTLS